MLFNDNSLGGGGGGGGDVYSRVSRYIFYRDRITRYSRWRDEISWISLARGYSQAGIEQRAKNLLILMRTEPIESLPFGSI